MNFGKMAFGVLVIAVGVLLLAIKMGFAPPDTIPVLLPFWPLLLIAFGLAFLAAALKNPALGCLAVAIILGGVGVGVYWAMHRHAKGEVSHGVTAIDTAKSNIQRLEIRTHTFFGSLDVGSAPPRSRTLSIDVRNVAAGKGGYGFQVSGKIAQLDWPERRGPIQFAPVGAGVRIEAPAWMPVSLDSWARCSSTHADFTRLAPARLAFDEFASSLRLDIGVRGRLDEIHIKGFLSTVRVRIPNGNSVRLAITSPFTMKSLPSDFVEHAPGRGKGRTYTSEGRGHMLRIFVDGPLLQFKIERVEEPVVALRHTARGGGGHGLRG